MVLGSTIKLDPLYNTNTGNNASMLTSFLDDSNISLPGVRIIAKGAGIDPNESNQIQTACFNAVQRGDVPGAEPLSRVISEDIKRRLGGQWFVFISNYGQEDYNFSLTRCKGIDYLVLVIMGKKIQINRLAGYSPIGQSVAQSFVQTQPTIQQSFVSTQPDVQVNAPEITSSSLLVNQYVNQIPMASNISQPFPQNNFTNYRIISVGNGSLQYESSQILSICIQCYQQGAFPLSRICAESIKAKIGGDWLVFISNYCDNDYNFSLTRCKEADYVILVIGNKKFQICRLKANSQI
ncbi:MAG: hypothetical protein HUJ61_00710 [Bacilli bacterium]|nr:hypothetical protein [Bacilli bacterium]